ncbi:MAG TPA: glycosyltransferase, partial [Anaerolineae bacterium]|nr:glycosyltransferase [Anaerolineae bacterium]
MIAQVIGLLYTAVLAALAVYALHIMILIGLYFRHRHDPQPTPPTPAEAQLPVVTVQVPLRNERYVAGRVLQAVAALDWPRDRLELQILDDSDDETTLIVEAECTRLRKQGYQVTLLHRTHPTGHKAGALAAGTQQARGEFIALFDADFCPEPDFLRR